MAEEERAKPYENIWQTYAEILKLKGEIALDLLGS